MTFMRTKIFETTLYQRRITTNDRRRKMNMKKTQYMTYLAMFLAIEVILVVTPLGYMPIGPLSVTTMHIPVIIAGIILGKKAGASLGFVFGLTSMIRATMQPSITSFCFSPFVTIGEISGNWESLFIAFVPRILLGYLAGLAFEKLSERKMYDLTSVTIASLIGALTNTILVLSGIYLFFGEAYANAVGVAYNTLISVLCGVIATNGIVEAILAAIISSLVYKALKHTIKH